MNDPTENDDLVACAQAIYDERLRANLERDHMHEFVAIELESGDYFLGKRMIDASSAARKAHPDRLPFVMRVGHVAAIMMVSIFLPDRILFPHAKAAP